MGLYDASDEAATPTTPAAGRKIFYPKADGWYTIDELGVERRVIEGIITSPLNGDQLVFNGADWVNLANASGGAGGAAKTLFLDETDSVADNFFLSPTPSATAEDIDSAVCNSGTNGGVTFIERYVTDALGGTQIEGGVWVFNTYAAVSSDTGVSEIVTRLNQRVLKTGTVTMTGAGATRTMTASGTPFVVGDADASILNATLVETPNQTFWITGYTSSSVVTVTPTDGAGYVNESGVNLTAMYYKLFEVTTGDITGTAPALYSTSTIQPTFAIDPTDCLVAAYFGKTDSGVNKTVSLYHGGNEHYTNIVTPLTQRHGELAGLNADDHAQYPLVDGTRGFTGQLPLALGAVLTEQAAPSTPASGKVAVYAKTDGVIYSKDDAGTETALGGQTIPSGAVMAYAMNSVPSGWLACDGTAISRTTFAALFTAIGTTYGVGDGSTTFNLPDMRGYFPRGYGTNSDGTASGTFGAKQADAYLNHSHTAATSSDGAHTHTVQGYVNGSGSITGFSYLATGDGNQNDADQNTSSNGAHTHTVTVNTSTTGGTETRPRNIPLLYCIKT